MASFVFHASARRDFWGCWKLTRVELRALPRKPPWTGCLDNMKLRVPGHIHNRDQEPTRQSQGAPDAVMVLKVSIYRAQHAIRGGTDLASSSWACRFRTLMLASLVSRHRTRRSAELKWFLIEFCDRPGNNFAISTQALPSRPCAAMSVSSSSALHGPFRIAGSRWQIHRSRHCFPDRLRISLLTELQLSLLPCCSTKLRSFWSSSRDQGIRIYDQVHARAAAAQRRATCSAVAAASLHVEDATARHSPDPCRPVSSSHQSFPSSRVPRPSCRPQASCLQPEAPPVHPSATAAASPGGGSARLHHRSSRCTAYHHPAQTPARCTHRSQLPMSHELRWGQPPSPAPQH